MLEKGNDSACAVKMAASGENDLLFDIRCALYIGNYQQCVTDAQKLKVLLRLRLARVGVNWLGSAREISLSMIASM